MTLQSFDKTDSDEARQFLLDRRCERLHPKRHRTMNRSKRLNAKKRNRVETEMARREAKFKKYKAKVRAYWQGIGDHP